jgi:hypothetical protein
MLRDSTSHLSHDAFTRNVHRRGLQMLTGAIKYACAWSCIALEAGAGAICHRAGSCTHRPDVTFPGRSLHGQKLQLSALTLMFEYPRKMVPDTLKSCRAMQTTLWSWPRPWPVCSKSFISCVPTCAGAVLTTLHRFIWNRCE